MYVMCMYMYMYIILLHTLVSMSSHLLKLLLLTDYGESLLPKFENADDRMNFLYDQYGKDRVDSVYREWYELCDKTFKDKMNSDIDFRTQMDNIVINNKIVADAANATNADSVDATNAVDDTNADSVDVAAANVVDATNAVDADHLTTTVTTAD